MKFILTIDTEADNQWNHGRELSVENIRFVPRFQDLCNKYNIKPTYLVTSEICSDEYARELFKDYIKSQSAEVGAHLHCWTTPPFQDIPGYRFNDKHHAFATELRVGLAAEKILNLTNHIKDSFGINPTSFRSGRYGYNEIIARILIENGYIVDSSVTPFIDWTSHSGMPGGNGGPNFMNHSVMPSNIKTETGSLLEIPITILPSRFPLNRNFNLSRFFFKNVDTNIFLRLLRKLFFQHQPLWLRPFPHTNISMMRELICQAEKMKLPFLVMMFHSSELMPGGSKYWPDEHAVEKLYTCLEQFFELVNSKNIKSVSLSEAASGFIV